MDFATFFLALDPNQLALGAIATLGIVSILRGWIVPRSVLVDRMKDKDQQISSLTSERDDWKTAYLKGEESKAVLMKQNTDLTDGAGITNRLIESLRNRIERDGHHPISRQIEG